MIHVTCRLTARTAISSGTLRSVIEYGLAFLFCVRVNMSCLSCRADKARRAWLCYWWPQRRRGERTVLANGDAINRSLTADKTAVLNGRWVRISCHCLLCALHMKFWQQKMLRRLWKLLAAVTQVAEELCRQHRLMQTMLTTT